MLRLAENFECAMRNARGSSVRTRSASGPWTTNVSGRSTLNGFESWATALAEYEWSALEPHAGHMRSRGAHANDERVKYIDAISNAAGAPQRINIGSGSLAIFSPRPSDDPVVPPSKLQVLPGRDARHASLCLVTGANATGKEFLLQGILVAQQALVSHRWLYQPQRPDGLDAGTADDVVCQLGGTLREVLLEACLEDDKTYRFRFDAPEEALVLQVVDRPSFGAFDLTYLGAERVGPRELLETDSVPDEDLRVGTQGEFTAQVLARSAVKVGKPCSIPRHRDERRRPARQAGRVLDARHHPGHPDPVRAPRADDQRARAAPQAQRRDNLAPPTEHRLWRELCAADHRRRPARVAGIAVLVENPEAHLHPAGSRASAASSRTSRGRGPGRGRDPQRPRVERRTAGGGGGDAPDPARPDHHPALSR